MVDSWKISEEMQIKENLKKKNIEKIKYRYKVDKLFLYIFLKWFYLFFIFFLYKDLMI